MKKTKLFPSILRVIDANLNRYKEGIRVVEDIYRYVYNNKEVASKLKQLRHIDISSSSIDMKTLLNSRDVKNDVLKTSIQTELKRETLEDIILANIKRAEESARVLEELFKLENLELSEKFKQNRYLLYNIEKEIFNESF